MQATAAATLFVLAIVFRVFRLREDHADSLVTPPYDLA
jgi:hypothetical protein